MSEGQRQPWARQPGERALWFGRFAIYRDLGPNRTVMDAWRVDNAQHGKSSPAKAPNNRWYAVCAEWHWKQRAAAFDEYMDAQRLLARREEIRLKREAEAQARAENRKRRRDLLTGFLAKLAAAMQAFDVEGANLTELTRATQMVAEQLRAEYNDLPTQRFGFESEDELDAAIEAEFARIVSAAGGLAVLDAGAESAPAAALAADADADPGGPGQG